MAFCRLEETSQKLPTRVHKFVYRLIPKTVASATSIRNVAKRNASVKIPYFFFILVLRRYQIFVIASKYKNFSVPIWQWHQRKRSGILCTKIQATFLQWNTKKKLSNSHYSLHKTVPYLLRIFFWKYARIIGNEKEKLCLIVILILFAFFFSGCLSFSLCKLVQLCNAR